MKRLLPALCLLLASAAACAAGRLLVGVEEQRYLPLSTVEAGEYRGFARELLDAFAADEGYQLEYRPLPVTRLYANFFEGRIDLKFPDNPNWRQNLRAGRDVHYSKPVIAYLDGTFTLPDRHEPIDAVRTLGTVAGFTPWVWRERIAGGQVGVRENSDFRALVQQALSGRFDAAYASAAVIDYELTHGASHPGALTLRTDLPHDRGHYFLSTLNHPEIIARFDAWLVRNAARVAQMKARAGVENGVSP